MCVYWVFTSPNVEECLTQIPLYTKRIYVWDWALTAALWLTLYECLWPCSSASRVPFLPGRTMGSDTGLSLPLERSDLIMLPCPPSLFISFFISCRNRGEEDSEWRGKRCSWGRKKASNLRDETIAIIIMQFLHNWFWAQGNTTLRKHNFFIESLNLQLDSVIPISFLNSSFS